MKDSRFIELYLNFLTESYKILVTSALGMYPLMHNNQEIIKQETAVATVQLNDSTMFNLDEVANNVEKYVVGQNEAKRSLLAEIFCHLIRIQGQEDLSLPRNNVLIIGPSGTGKSYLIKTIAKCFKLPYYIADMTGFTEAGYVGDNVENILSRLIEAANGDLKLAEKGIIFLDEIDKVAKRETLDRDIRGEGVQQALLKIIEGTKLSCRYKGSPVTIDTSKILFVCAGAFIGIDKIIAARIKKCCSIGFGASKELANINQGEILKSITDADLIEFGLIPEFIGRIPQRVVMESLTKDYMIKILRESQDSIITKYQNLWKVKGIELVFTDGALEEIARRATTYVTGARALEEIIAGFMPKALFLAYQKSAKRCVVTPEVIISGGEPLCEQVY